MEFIYKIILLIIIIVILYIIINNTKENFYLIAEQGYIYNSEYDMYLMISNDTISFTKNIIAATLFQLTPNGEYNYFIRINDEYIKLDIDTINNSNNYTVSVSSNNNDNGILQLSNLLYINFTGYGWLLLNSNATYSIIDTMPSSTIFTIKLL